MECKKLKFIPDRQFKELIDLGTSPVRPDSEIDRDCRVIEYDEFLHSKGYEYKETSLGRSGGNRRYENKTTKKAVEIMRDSKNEIQFWLGKLPSYKEIGYGKGLNNLKNKI